MEMGPKKWWTQEAFIYFRQKKKQQIWKEMTGKRNLGLRCSISEESKQNLN